MYSIYQLYSMNGMKTPFEIRRGTWGGLTITVDLVDNFRFSGGDWRCDAFTKSDDYYSDRYGVAIRDDIVMSVIGCANNYSWCFVDMEHDEDLIFPPAEA